MLCPRTHGYKGTGTHRGELYGTIVEGLLRFCLVGCRAFSIIIFWSVAVVCRGAETRKTTQWKTICHTGTRTLG
jgi:hypothetical protein